MAKEPLQPQDKYVLRFPNGMRDRIKKAAERSGRSMNAEIVAALETFYPEEPSIEEVLDRVHKAIDQASHVDQMPYRKVLIAALDELAEQLASGIELDQFRRPAIGPEYKRSADYFRRMRRWKRASDDGVETPDFVREMQRGMFDLPRDRVYEILKWFKEGRSDLVLKTLRLSEIKFMDSKAILGALNDYYDQYYRFNWGDPKDAFEAQFDDE